MGVEFPSYVDDLHCWLYDVRASCRGMEEVEWREGIGDLVNRVSMVLKEVAAERGLPLAEDKEEWLILRSGGGQWGRRGICEKVKWLGVILDEDLDFGPIGRPGSLRHVTSSVHWMGWGQADGG